MNIIIPTLGKERQKTYSPFLPICKETGKVLEIPIIEINKKNFSLIFDNNGKSNTLIGEKEITLTPDIMEPMESEKPKDSVPDPFRKELVEYRVVPEVLMLQKNGKDAGCCNCTGVGGRYYSDELVR